MRSRQERSPHAVFPRPHILCAINDPANLDQAAFAHELRHHGLNEAAGIRALLRLATADAVAKTLRWALGEPWPHAPGSPVTAADVLNAIWLPEPAGVDGWDGDGDDTGIEFDVEVDEDRERDPDGREDARG